MCPSSPKEAEQFFNSVPKENKNVEIVVAPPFVYLPKLKIENLKLKIGAQNVFWADSGAYTGEISPKMLKNLGVEYVIIGHSERRKSLNETDEMVNKKVLAALKLGLKVILCVGEDLKIREKGKKAVENFIKNQLQKDLRGIENYKLKIENLLVAYEPVWALSTNKNGHSDTSEDALEMIKFIKDFISVRFKINGLRVLYGGSVDSKNIKNFIKYDEIDGALVGGASLKIEEVKKIILICQTTT